MLSSNIKIKIELIFITPPPALFKILTDNHILTSKLSKTTCGAVTVGHYAPIQFPDLQCL